MLNREGTPHYISKASETSTATLDEFITKRSDLVDSEVYLIHIKLLESPQVALEKEDAEHCHEKDRLVLEQVAVNKSIQVVTCIFFVIKVILW